MVFARCRYNALVLTVGVLILPELVMDGRVEWCEAVPCGQGSHEVQFSFTPWSGVHVKFNPCDHIPSLLRKYSVQRCTSKLLALARDLELQAVWFGADQNLRIPAPISVLTKVRDLAAHRLVIAKDILATAGVNPTNAIETQDSRLAWAGLMLMHPETFKDETRDALEDWCASESALMQLHAAFAFVGSKVAWSLQPVMNLVTSQHVHVELQAQVLAQLAKHGNEEVMTWLLRDYRELSLTDRQVFKFLTQCINNMRECCGDRVNSLALQCLADVTTEEEDNWTMWFRLILLLDDLKPKDLLQFGLSRGDTVMERIAKAVLSEQYLSHALGQVVDEVSVHPELAPYLVPGLVKLLQHSSSQGDDTVKRLRTLLTISKDRRVRRLANQKLIHDENRVQEALNAFNP